MENKSAKKTAILVDGGYYRTRAMDLWGKKPPQDRADELYKYCMLHIIEPDEPRELYRLFYYDCPPMSSSMVHPLTNKTTNHASSTSSKWAKDFYRSISEKHRTALRMGELAESSARYVLKEHALTDLIAGTKTISTLTENDFRLDVKQKGVDMRIGLDVASMAYGKHVDQIILIAGDSDFVPVAKMARKNGLDFILDPMKQNVKHSMIEHVDDIECYTALMSTQSAPTQAVPAQSAPAQSAPAQAAPVQAAPAQAAPAQAAPAQSAP